jgi:hypothetical protein
MRVLWLMLFVVFIGLTGAAHAQTAFDAKEWQPADPALTQQKLAAARAKLPELSRLNDEMFIDAMHQLYYQNISTVEVYERLGYVRKPVVASTTPLTAARVMVWVLLLASAAGYMVMRRRERVLSRRSSKESTQAPSWLLRFLLFQLSVCPFLALGVYYNDLTAPRILSAAASTQLDTYYAMRLVLLGAVAALSLFAILRLRFSATPSSRTIAMTAVAAWALYGVLMPLLYPAGQSLKGASLGQLIWCLVWLGYLGFSSNVATRFNCISSQPIATG